MTLPPPRSSSRKRGPRFTSGARTPREVRLRSGRRYGVKRLVRLEAFDTRDDTFRRERQMKVWRRAWKIDLIEKTNPGWRDLYPEIC